MSDGTRSGPVARALRILEVVAERGGATAREIADATGLPLPTVYRLAAELADADYLVHIRSESRYELGHQVHALGLSLHRRLGLSRGVTREISLLHESTGFAAYLAILRGSTLVIVHVVDSPDCPRLHPMRFGFHEAPHATAFGKIQLAEMEVAARREFVDRQDLRAFTANTLTEHAPLARELAVVGRDGIAWEHEEFLAGWACAAVPVRAADISLVGAIAVSAQAHRFPSAAPATDRLVARLRQVASRVGAQLRGTLN
ncbi:IclR family transcriptional regulator [Nakamurella alba]|uniref:IclR family transcriptional regulator n=1 Tax=Nakamurella alba TaxID=2665158 RepID=UPI0018AB17DD|nr:IclR family transcriptional regulator [Nakamurella alba]